MIKRDIYGIICQHSISNLEYLDGGDSAARTGIMAMCDSVQDQKLSSAFVIDGKGVRHPMQNPYDNPNNFTRDQLIQLTAGLYASNSFSEARSLLKANYPLCQNTHTTEGFKKPFWARDVITPSQIGHLITCANISWLKWTLPFFRMFLLLDILWNCFIAPDDEQNQIICMAVTAGPKYVRLYKKWHPHYEKSVRDYWGTQDKFRHQPEIAERIIRKIAPY